MIVTGIKTRRFERDENLLAFILEYVPQLRERDVVVVTSKIVALSQGRYVSNVQKDAFESLVAREGTILAKTKHVLLTIKDALLMANAGIDHSNAQGGVVLLPSDSFTTSAAIRAALMKHFGVRELGVIISDSRTYPLRKGVVGVALGHAGLCGIHDYTGTPDIDGRLFQFESMNIVDCIATAAILEMGEGSEQTPLAVVSDCRFMYPTESTDRNELTIAPEDDMYFCLIPENQA